MVCKLRAWHHDAVRVSINLWCGVLRTHVWGAPLFGVKTYWDEQILIGIWGGGRLLRILGINAALEIDRGFLPICPRGGWAA